MSGRWKIVVWTFMAAGFMLVASAQDDDKEVRIPYSDEDALAAIDELGALVGAFEEPADGKMSRAKLEELVKKLGDGVELEETDEGVVIVVRKLTVRRRTRQWRKEMRGWLRETFPEAAKKLDRKYGWRQWQPDEKGEPQRLRVEASDCWDKPVVVLVHGLDEPGLLWSQVAPALLEAGYQPLEFMYPNDQPVKDSAIAFAGALQNLRKRGVTEVSIVCHSMGGLVSRECLTSEQHMGGSATGHNDFPDVRRLITIGTPNHGSQLARLRLFLEVRDQGAQLLNGNNPLLGAFLDGNSEALGDILPDSPFLTALNKRPLPEGVKITVIAGRASPLGVADVRENKRRFLEFFNLSPTNSEPAKTWTKLIDGIGDGAVALSSTRLAGVADHVTVEGDHVLMLRDYLRRKNFVPPALPIILDRLERDRTTIATKDPKGKE